MKTKLTKEQNAAFIRANRRFNADMEIWHAMNNWRQINEFNGGGYFSCPEHAMGFPAGFAKHRQFIR